VCLELPCSLCLPICSRLRIGVRVPASSLIICYWFGLAPGVPVVRFLPVFPPVVQLDVRLFHAKSSDSLEFFDPVCVSRPLSFVPVPCPFPKNPFLQIRTGNEAVAQQELAMRPILAPRSAWSTLTARLEHKFRNVQGFCFAGTVSLRSLRCCCDFETLDEFSATRRLEC